MTTVKVYALTLTLLTGDKAPEGPGWYVIGHYDEGQTGGNLRRKLSVLEAQELGRSFGGIIHPQEGEIHPFEIVAKGTEGAKEIIKQELEEAERVATRVGGLRKALGEFSE